MKRITPLLLPLLLAACDHSPVPMGYRLDNGALVQVDDGGGLRLAIGARPLVRVSSRARPTIRTFDETPSGTLAIWSFARENEETFPLTEYDGVERTDDGVVMRYRSADDAWAGELRVTPAGDEATRLRFELTRSPADADSIALPIHCDDLGTFHGFGEQYNATDQRGEAFQLLVTEQGIGRGGELRYLTGDAHTTYFPMPWYIDARGFGVLIETSYRVDVDLCASDPAVAWLDVQSGAPVELLVFHGPRPLDVIRQLGDHLGRPAAPPDWAWGLWIGAQGGTEEVLAEADRLEAAGIAASALWVQDWTGTRINVDGGFGVQYRWTVDEELYPDLAGTIAELHDRGYRFLAYANPFVDPALDDHFPEMDAEGWLVRDPSTGATYLFHAPNGRAAHPDTTNPAAREYVMDALRDMVEIYGIDGWMADFSEWLPLDAVLSDGSDPLAYHNRYPIEWQRMSREVLEETRPDGDWVMFARAGWTGVQSVAQIHWAGDQEATWSETDGLPTVVPALLNLGLSGQPFVTHDIAGFSGGPSTKELFMRWVELGAFTPIMRTHEGNDREHNWSWERDAETTAHFRRFAAVHDALRPELRALAREAQRTGAPMVRHLMLVFPRDRETWSIDDQLMLGDDLLVAPVVQEGVTTREVYLPDGLWYHVWSGDTYRGGRTIEVDAPLGEPPVFSLGRDRPDLRLR